MIVDLTKLAAPELFSTGQIKPTVVNLYSDDITVRVCRILDIALVEIEYQVITVCEARKLRKVRPHWISIGHGLSLPLLPVKKRNWGVLTPQQPFHFLRAPVLGLSPVEL